MAALFSKAPQQEKQRTSLSFSFYEPSIPTDRLVPGIDNVRFDVSLSSKFLQTCRKLLLQLLVKHSGAGQLLNEPPAALKPADVKEFKRQLQNLLLNALSRANIEKNVQTSLLLEAAIFKHLAAEMQAQYGTVVVQAREKVKLFQGPNRWYDARGYQFQEVFGNFQKNRKIILYRVSAEVLLWVTEVREVLRKNIESFFGAEDAKPFKIFSTPLVFTDEGKNDYLYLDRYVMLGNFSRDPDQFELVQKQVLGFLEWADAQSPEAQQYRDAQAACDAIVAQIEQLRIRQQEMSTSRPSRFLSLGGANPASDETGQQIESLGIDLQLQRDALRLAAAEYGNRLMSIVRTAENADLLVNYFQTEQQIEELKKHDVSNLPELAALDEKAERQREAVDRLYDHFLRVNLISYVLAAYETARISQHFCPPINPQQLKVSLIDAEERKKVTHLVREYRLPAEALETLEEAARRVRDAGFRETRSTLARFLKDFMRSQQDRVDFQCVREFMERVHIPTDPKQRELSQINHTLYQYLLPEEEKPVEEKIAAHVILKADIRDSSSITERLLERGLNPASYFSLNFFGPTQKLLARYGAAKVFLEGDALILAILEREGDSLGANTVGRACSLARNILQVVRTVNDRATQNQLPLIELGIGVCFQNSAPTYLMDGDTPIMISKALNESDRLSSCGKLARHIVGQRNRFFNVFVSQLLPDTDAVKGSEEFLVHYNVHGIEISEMGFEKLCRELSLTRLELKLPLLGQPEVVELFCGSLPLGPNYFHRIIVRRGRIPLLHPKTFQVVEYTSRNYFEVCCSKPVYEYASKQLGW